MIDLLKRVAGFLVFDLVWLSAVAGRQDWLWATALLVLVQIGVTVYSGRFQLRLYLELVLAGLILELIVSGSGLLQFDGGLLPTWLILLWLGYPAMALGALDWLRDKLWLAVLLGVVAGPMTYAVGLGIGAATVEDAVWPMIVAYAIGWGGYMALFVKLMQLRLPQNRRTA